MRNKSIVAAMVLGGGGLALIGAFVMMLVSHRSLPQETPGPNALGTPKPTVVSPEPTKSPPADPFAGSPTVATGAKPAAPEQSPSAPAPSHSPVAAAIVAAGGGAPPVVDMVKVPVMPSIVGSEAATGPTAPVSPTVTPGPIPVVANPGLPATSAALGNARPNTASGMNPNASPLDVRGMMPQGSIVMPSLSFGQGGPIQPVPVPAAEPPKPPSSIGKFRVGDATLTLPGQK